MTPIKTFLALSYLSRQTLTIYNDISQIFNDASRSIRLPIANEASMTSVSIFPNHFKTTVILRLWAGAQLEFECHIYTPICIPLVAKTFKAQTDEILSKVWISPVTALNDATKRYVALRNRLTNDNRLSRVKATTSLWIFHFCYCRIMSILIIYYC